MADAPGTDELFAAAEADAGGNRHPEPPGEQSRQAAPSGGATEDTDSFSGIDPNTLPEQLRPIYRSMQGDYTRKTQELAGWRRVGEELGVAPEDAANAVRFMKGLESDPDFALAVHDQLSQALQAAGLTPSQAKAEATRRMQESDEFGDDDEYDYEADPRDNEVEELKKRLDQFEQQILAERAAAELDLEETRLRNVHPDWSDRDIDMVFNIAVANGGDIQAAERSYNEWRGDLLSEYLQSKASARSDYVPGGGYSEPLPEVPRTERGDVDFAKINEMSTDRLVRALAEQE